MGRVKITLVLSKAVPGARWEQLHGAVGAAGATMAGPVAAAAPPPAHARPAKDWDAVVAAAAADDASPGADGEAQGVDALFQQIYAGADDDTRRAMVKSFVESGGTALSTNWSDVQRGPVPVQPPSSGT